MTIIKWKVSAGSETPQRKEYEKETAHFYTYRSGSAKVARRDSKYSLYYRFFDSESEAVESIRKRAENKAEQKRIDQINHCGVELLAMLEEARATLEMWEDVAPALSLCADIDRVVAKAKGLVNAPTP